MAAKEKILLVSTDPGVRRSFPQNLSSHYEVISAVTFDEALAQYKNEQFHTVVTELEEGGAGAIEVITKLQQAAGATPIIVITTHSGMTAAADVLASGIYDDIARPFNLEELKLVCLHTLERRKLQEEIKEKNYFQENALVDSLTQVYNRRYFDELLQREEWRAKRYPQKFTLMKIDIDNFAKYNDYYGRPAGDRVLGLLGVMLRGRVRNTDAVSRYGGEEFAVITPHTDKQHAMILASRLLDAIAREEFVIEGNFRTKLTVSIGLATFNEDSLSKDELIKNSDLALRQAKQLGKNRVCLFGSPAK